MVILPRRPSFASRTTALSGLQFHTDSIVLCSGDRIWMTNSGGGEFFGSIILDPRRNLLFGVHLSGIVVAVDPYVGRVVARHNVGRSVAAELGPALSEDGSFLFVGTYGGQLLALTLA